MSDLLRRRARPHGAPFRRADRSAVLALTVAVAYFATARLSYAFSFQPAGVAVVWIPAGLMLGLLARLDRRSWPWALAGGFGGCLAADLSMGYSMVASLAGAGANLVESAVAARLLVHWAGPRPVLDRLRDVLALVVGCALVANALTAGLGVLVARIHGGTTGFAHPWFIWWIGDGIGMVIVAPLVLTWAAHRWGEAPWSGMRRVEAVALAGALALVAGLSLTSSAPQGALEVQPYMVFPLLLWAALRFGSAGAATATFLLAATTAASAARGLGPFAADDRTALDPLLDAYLYLGLASLFALVPAAVLGERERAERKRRASEAEYRDLFMSHPVPMWVFDAENLAFLAVNDAATSSYGYAREEFLSMTIADIRPPEDVPALLADVRAEHRGLDPALPWRHRRKSGEVFDVEVTSHEMTWRGRPAKLVMAVDVSERRHLQEQLLEAQKMEAVGRLAGGVAHDFNNLLGVIVGYAEMSLEDLGPREPVSANLREIHGAATRAAALVRQLLAFGRKQVLEPKVLDLNRLVADLGRMLDRTLGERITLVLELDERIGAVRADPSQLEQVITNLVINARDAMPRGGRLTLETAEVTLDDEYVREHFDVQPGRYVQLAVSDTGVGMDAETQRRAFEPFFTTKGELGTGLGLSTSYGIVRQAGGFLWLYTEPGRGTTFKIHLPLVDAAPDAATTGRAAAVARGDERILLVEDAASLRRVMRSALESRGYGVLEAESGSDALALARRERPVDLLVTDVVLPGLDGQELAERMFAERLAGRVLFVSGYTDDSLAGDSLARPGAAYLQKPFSIRDLLERVRGLLDEPPRSPSAL